MVNYNKLPEANQLPVLNVPPQLVIVTQPTIIRQPEVPYKCLYLVVLIVDLIQTIMAGLATIVLLFVVSALEFTAKNGGMASDTDGNRIARSPSGSVEDVSGYITILRLFLVALLVVLILIQYYGWKGFNQLHVRSIYIFAIVKGLGAVGSLIALFTLPASAMNVVMFFLNVSFTIIPIMFAREIRKLKL